MIEQKLIVGRYIELDTPQPVFAGPAVNGFREQIAVILHIDQSESLAAPVTNNPTLPGFNPTIKQQIAIGAQKAGEQIKSQFDRQRVSATAVGMVAKAHRNFVWLEWVGGIVNEVQPNGMDVLTGPMSGCWIMSYQRGGVSCVGHVGTVMEHGSADSIAARNAWNAFAASVPTPPFSGFNPFNDPWVGALPAQEPGELPRKTFALVTGAGTFHTVIAYPQAKKPTRIRIAGIQQNPATLPANGQIV